MQRKVFRESNLFKRNHRGYKILIISTIKLERKLEENSFLINTTKTQNKSVLQKNYYKIIQDAPSYKYVAGKIFLFASQTRPFSRKVLKYRLKCLKQKR